MSGANKPLGIALTNRTYAVIASIELIACGSMVLSDYNLFVFALCERKNEKKKTLKHRSAEGLKRRLRKSCN